MKTKIKIKPTKTKAEHWYFFDFSAGSFLKIVGSLQKQYPDFVDGYFKYTNGYRPKNSDTRFDVSFFCTAANIKNIARFVRRNHTTSFKIEKIA